MLSFRKIVNVLVLVSYVKMLLVSSFAMDVGPQVLPSKFKIQVDQKFNQNGQVAALDLKVLKRNAGHPSKDYVELQEDRVDFSTRKVTSNVRPLVDAAQLIEWTIPQLGKIQVGFDGRVSLNHIKFLSGEILKIKTPGLIFIEDCTISTLSMSSHGSVLMGGNQLFSVIAKHQASTGMIASGRTPDFISILSLKKEGTFTISARLSSTVAITGICTVMLSLIITLWWWQKILF